MTTTETNRIDEARLEAFVGQAVTDMGAAISGLLLHIGDRLGLYQAMAGAGPITAPALAARTGTAERYVREWLGNQAAGGYVVYDPVDGTFELPAEHAMVVADEDSPVFLPRLRAHRQLGIQDGVRPASRRRQISQSFLMQGSRVRFP